MRDRTNASGLRVFLALYLIVLGASITILPSGPLAVRDDLIWLRGLLTAVTGLLLLWIAPLPTTSRVVIAHVALAVPQVIFGIRLAIDGALSAGATLTIFGAAIAVLPLYAASTRSWRMLPAYPLGAFIALSVATQGLAIASGGDRYSVFVEAAGVPVAPYGIAMFICGGAGCLVSIRGTGTPIVLAALQTPGALLLLAAAVMGALYVSPAYWLLGTSAYLRVVGLLLSPWLRDVSVDWRSARARSTVAITTTAIVPILVLMTLLLYGPEWGTGMSEVERQALFGIVVLLELVVIGAAFVAAGRLTTSLRELARVVDEPNGLTGSSTARVAVAEVDVVREAVVGLNERLTRQNAELERANTDLALANAELRRANAAKDEFLGLVSHELKTPITSMLASATLLGRVDEAARRELVEDLESEADRLAAVVDNLLVLARPDSARIHGSEPTLLLRVVEAEAARFARRDPTRTVNVEGDRDIVVDAVPEQVSMVIRNFLSNAQKYGPPATPIDVRIGRHGGFGMVEVRDAGRSLSEAEANRVFEAFYRAPSMGPGASGIGIGLTVCQRIVGATGGEVAVSVGSSGTVFSFTLPLVVELDEPAPFTAIVVPASP